MKKHNKPEWVEDIQKEKIDLWTRHKNQYDLLSRLYISLTAVDIESIGVSIFWNGKLNYDDEYGYDYEFGLTDTEYQENFMYKFSDKFNEQYLDVYSHCKSPYSTVIRRRMRSTISDPDRWSKRQKVSISRRVNIHLKADNYCFEFISEADCDIGDKGYYKDVSSQLIDSSNEEILEADKVYDIYKWLTYNTDDIPAIGIPIAGEVVSNQAAPMRMLILFGLIVIALILLSNF
ncbi:MAG: hypothetical protein NZ811_04355 [Gammaproteobacteria bacterium]|nr:hypothetical protein [Gammaproteobacteria bacterium]